MTKIGLRDDTAQIRFRLRFDGLIVMSGKHSRPDSQRDVGGAAAALPIEAIRAHIRTNLAERIRVSDMAHIAGLDVFRFARALRREFQTTPYALVIATRIQVAENLLRSGMSVADAAQSVGFCDQSHLTRHFRRRLGITPARAQQRTPQ